MRWKLIDDHIARQYPYLKNITIKGPKAQIPEHIHPLLQYTSAMINRIILDDSDARWTIVLPRRNEVAKWIAFLVSLGLLAKDTPKSLWNHQEGQLAIINGEYAEFIKKIGNKIRIRCRDGFSEIPISKIYQMQPLLGTRRLARMQDISNTLNSTWNNRDRIKEIVGVDIGTVGHTKSVILVARLNEIEDFIASNSMEGEKLSDVLLWGKINPEGEVEPIGNRLVNGCPTCLICPDLFRLASYLSGHSDKVSGIIIDGTKFLLDNLQIFDDYMASVRIPIIHLSDEIDVPLLKDLSSRQFTLFHWDKETLLQSKSLLDTTELVDFKKINKTLVNYCTQAVDLVECSFNTLDHVHTTLTKLDSNVKSYEDSEINEKVRQLYLYLISMSRMLCAPDEQCLTSFHENIRKLSDELQKNSLWLTEQATHDFELAYKMFLQINSRKFSKQSHKISKLKYLLENEDSSNGIAVIVSNSKHIKACSDYWSVRVSNKVMARVRFLTVAESLHSRTPYVPDTVVVCGWLGTEKMYRLINSYICSKIILLTYSFEKNWFLSAARRWNRFKIEKNSLGTVFHLFGVSSDEIETNYLKSSNKISFLSSHTNDEGITGDAQQDIEEFEARMIQQSYAKFRSTTSSDSSVEAKLVSFLGGQFGWFTRTHRFPVVSHLINTASITQEIPKKTSDQLDTSDLVIFRESDKDIIREIADKALMKQGLGSLRDVSNTWRLCIKAVFGEIDNNLSKLVTLLRENGCQRHSVTIKNWLDNDELIGPRDLSDLESILKACNNPMINTLDVWSAIQHLRSLHLQASSYLQERMLTTLPKLVTSLQDHFFEQPYEIDIEDIGKVTILAVSEVGDQYINIDVKNINKLFLGDDST